VPALFGELDLSDVDTVVDVGGGSGRVLAEALRTHPGVRGVLVELPDALRSAEKELAAAGVADRVTLHAGSFFDDVPSGGQLYVLSRVLHNWTDEHAAVILRRVRQVMPEHGRLVVFEEFTDGKAPMVDLLMLVMLEGHDRTSEQYTELITSAGFEITAVRTPSGAGAGNESMIEARRGDD
jgi:cyclopropane fatty-acyl-phospholipid synthase-like methyltransferase